MFKTIMAYWIRRRGPTKKMFSRDRPALAAGKNKWSKHSIHTPLTKVEPSSSRTLAVTCFKSVMAYMGDRQYAQPVMLSQQLVGHCLAHKEIRTEIYCQIIKQLTANPSHDSEIRGWELIIICLASFRPSVDFENYLEFFVRSFAVPAHKYIQTLHQTAFAGDRKEVPTLDEIAQLTQGSKASTRLGYSISVADFDVRRKMAPVEEKERRELELPRPSTTPLVQGVGPVFVPGAAIPPSATPNVDSRQQ